jgi:hypothetical protein
VGCQHPTAGLTGVGAVQARLLPARLQPDALVRGEGAAQVGAQGRVQGQVVVRAGGGETGGDQRAGQAGDGGGLPVQRQPQPAPNCGDARSARRSLASGWRVCYALPRGDYPVIAFVIAAAATATPSSVATSNAHFPAWLSQ